MKTLKQQNGLTMWGWLVVLSMVLFICLQAFALFSPAVKYNTVKSVLNAVSEDPALKGKTGKEIRQTLAKKLSFNDITDLDFKDKELFQMKKKKGGSFLITVKYEQRVSLFGPLDMVLTLDHEVSVGGT